MSSHTILYPLWKQQIRWSRLPIIRFLTNQAAGIHEERSTISVEIFRETAFTVEKPLVIRPSRSTLSRSDHDPSHSFVMPALTTWFTGSVQRESGKPEELASVSSYLRSHFPATFLLPYELLYPTSGSDKETNSVEDFIAWLSWQTRASDLHLARLLQECLNGSPHTSEHATESRFIRFSGPMDLITAGLEFNNRSEHESKLQNLYIAQAPLNTLPPSLQADIPTPELVRTAGRGDVYDSSIWLGLEPTYTPWHRDPNPNMFYQLCGSKVVRSLPPARGRDIFQQVQVRLRRTSCSMIRGEEMMQGAERQAFLDAIWADSPTGIMEACLHPGDALFIPKGWWHSFKSVGQNGGLNGSVNWWFR